MNEYKVWYYKDRTLGKTDWLIVKAEAFHVLDCGSLIFFNGDESTQNVHAFAFGEWVQVQKILE